MRDVRAHAQHACTMLTAPRRRARPQPRAPSCAPAAAGGFGAPAAGAFGAPLQLRRLVRLRPRRWSIRRLHGASVHQPSEQAQGAHLGRARGKPSARPPQRLRRARSRPAPRLQPAQASAAALAPRPSPPPADSGRAGSAVRPHRGRHDFGQVAKNDRRRRYRQLNDEWQLQRSRTCRSTRTFHSRSYAFRTMRQAVRKRSPAPSAASVLRQPRLPLVRFRGAAKRLRCLDWCGSRHSAAAPADGLWGKHGERVWGGHVWASQPAASGFGRQLQAALAPRQQAALAPRLLALRGTSGSSLRRRLSPCLWGCLRGFGAPAAREPAFGAATGGAFGGVPSGRALGALLVRQLLAAARLERQSLPLASAVLVRILRCFWRSCDRRLRGPGYICLSTLSLYIYIHVYVCM